MTATVVDRIARSLGAPYSGRADRGVYGVLANYGVIGGDEAVDQDAVVLAMFSSGEQGVWYDPSDLSTMFQDAAGTTPVTADGQPVGKILDKSGNNNHATQATAAKRPLYKTSGGLHWLQFDGVDDYIQGAWTTPTLLSTVFTGMRRLDSNLWAMFMRAESTSSGYTGVCETGSTSPTENAAGTPSYFVNQVLVTPSQRGTLATAMGVGTSKVLTIEDVNFNEYPFPWLAFGFGFYSGAASQFNTYGVIVLGRPATPQETADTEAWVNGKTGAY